MSCSPFDLKDYFVKELPENERRLTEAHVKTCQACREELERLRLAEAAMLSLRDEEIPQRVAFVSDKIFEPSPWRRWWAGFWGSTARLGFASAAMLSIAITIYALRPAGPVIAQPVMVPPVVQTGSDSAIQSRIDSAVAKAVAEADARQTEKTRLLVDELERTRQRLLLAADEFDYQQKRANTRILLGSNYGPKPDTGEVQ